MLKNGAQQTHCLLPSSAPAIYFSGTHSWKNDKNKYYLNDNSCTVILTVFRSFFMNLPPRLHNKSSKAATIQHHSCLQLTTSSLESYVVGRKLDCRGFFPVVPSSK